MEGLREGVSLNIAIYNKKFMLKIVSNKMHFKHYKFSKNESCQWKGCW